MPDTPFAAYLNEPDAARPSGDPQDAGEAARKAAADERPDEVPAVPTDAAQVDDIVWQSPAAMALLGAAGETRSAGVEAAPGADPAAIAGIVVPPADNAATVPSGPAPAAALVRASSAFVPPVLAPQNTLFAAPPDNSATAEGNVPPGPATGRIDGVPTPHPPAAGEAAAADLAAAPIAQAPRTASPTTQSAPAAPDLAAATGSADVRAASVPGIGTASATAESDRRANAGRFGALVRTAALADADPAGRPAADDTELLAPASAKPAVETSPLQTQQLQPNALPQPMPERLVHLTPAAPAAHTGQAATAETSAAVPVAGLALEIAARAQHGSSRFEIRLDPPELGRIDVRLDVDQRGQVTSRLVVEKAETLDLLKRDAPELERALQQAGLKTGEGGLQFALRDQTFAGRDNRESPAMARIVVPEAEPPALESVASGYGRWLRTDGGVDIRV